MPWEQGCVFSSMKIALRSLTQVLQVTKKKKKKIDDQRKQKN